MIICDRCKTPDPKHYNCYIGGKDRDLCDNCFNDYQKLTKEFESIEQVFIKCKKPIHIDYQWEDLNK